MKQVRKEVMQLPDAAVLDVVLFGPKRAFAVLFGKKPSAIVRFSATFASFSTPSFFVSSALKNPQVHYFSIFWALRRTSHAHRRYSNEGKREEPFAQGPVLKQAAPARRRH